MSLYLDTSCLLKLLVEEPESARVRDLIAQETSVIVSSYAELEAEQVLRGLRFGGRLSARQEGRLLRVLGDFRGLPPFEHRPLPYDLAAIARRQAMNAAVHCRTADRLHLAAMEALGLRRLLTNDDAQAVAAAELGFGVVQPK